MRFWLNLGRKYREQLAYLVVGGLTTLLSNGVFALLFNGLGWERNGANALSIVLAVLFAYVTNKLFVFRSQTGSGRALLREAANFFAARGLTMLLEFGGLALLCDVFHVQENIAKLVCTIVVILLNYILSKLFVFRKTAGKTRG